MAALSDWFWDERFWLPHNVTWADLEDPAPGVEYPKAGHLLRALPLALGLFAVRIFFERYVARTLFSLLPLSCFFFPCLANFLPPSVSVCISPFYSSLSLSHHLLQNAR